MKPCLRLLLLSSLLVYQAHSVWSAEALAASVQNNPLRLVVLPFKVLGTTQQPWLGESFAEHLLLALSQSDKLSLIERSQIDQLLKEQGLSQSAFADEATAPQLGRLLGAQQMVLGSVQVQGEQLRVSLRLVDASTGQIVPGQTLQLSGNSQQLPELQTQLAIQLLQKLTGLSAIEAQNRVEALNFTSSAQASALYFQAQNLLQNFAYNHYQQAMELYKQAIALDPQFTLAYVALSEAYSVRVGMGYMIHSSQDDDLEQALYYAQKAIQLKNHPAAVFRALAQAHAAQGNHAAAIKALEQALELKPGDPVTVQAWIRQQDTEQMSVAELKSALLKLGADPEDPEILLSFANIQIRQLKQTLKQKTRSQAEVDQEIQSIQTKLDKVLELQPTNSNAYQRRAELEVILGHPEQAKAMLDKNLAQDPHNFFLHFISGAVMFGAPGYSEYVTQHLQKAIELNPKFAFAHSFLGMHAYMIQHDLALGRKYFLAAHQLLPESAMPPMMLGYIAFEAAEIPQAYAYMIKAYENQGKVRGEKVSNGQILLTLFQLAAAVKPAEQENWKTKLLAGGPGIEPRDLRSLVSFLAEKEDYPQAIQVFAQYTQKPGYQLTDEDQQLYKWVYLKQELKKQPDNAAVLNDLGQMALAEQDLKQAQDYLEKAYQLNQNQPTIVYNLGHLRLQQQRYPEAVSLFEQVLKAQPKHIKARLNLGRAQLRLGQADKAKALWQAVLLEDPGNTEALSALEQIEQNRQGD